MTADQDPTRRAELLFLLRYGGAMTDEIAERAVDLAIAEAGTEQATEIDRLGTELDATKDRLDHLDRWTLPRLRRESQHHQDGKKRWRNRAEKAEARVAALEKAAVEARAALGSLCYDLEDPGTAALGALHLVSQATVWTETGPDFAALALVQHDAEVLRETADMADPEPPEVSFFGDDGHTVAAWLQMLADRKQGGDL